MHLNWISFTTQLITTGILVALISPALNAGTHFAQPKNVTYNPPNRGAPGETQDAGSRPACPTSEIPFTAIAPSTNWGETLASHPTFWLYLPYAASAVELTLSDEGHQEAVYRTTFQTAAAGIGQFSLPEDAPALEPDRLYRWQFTFVCDAETQSHFQVTGVIVRRSPTVQLTQQLQTASPKEQVALLAAHGFWYDALDQLNQLRRLNPTDETLESDWESLLQHPVVGLEDLLPVPLTECCS
ncbi:DUF928 domain-containing protein [Leptolyngbya sp. FACHB-671]|uniref:DUF928 domain-containing protein n=1 Tax=Leptolyngbya sp. FACHB-671 TaxID=2692812 RepID=UPI0016868C5B|nr:DUF928 domain-containing protein [Leptolyngbya sp. FACHB-671]MBD2069459.1 DUF928 domain-containing protein [Leptolyngbya sp. FACHB-671]